MDTIIPPKHWDTITIFWYKYTYIDNDHAIVKVYTYLDYEKITIEKEQKSHKWDIREIWWCRYIFNWHQREDIEFKDQAKPQKFWEEEKKSQNN